MAPFMSISGLGGANPSFAKGGVSYVTANLILFLDAGDSSSYSGSGTDWNDISGQSNNATLVNGVGYSTDDGGSLTFDGSNDYVSETSALSDSFLQGDYSISFWMKFDALNTGTSGSYDRILIHHGSSSSNAGLHLVNRNTKFHFGLYGNDLEGTSNLSTDTWYNVVFTLNNTSYDKQIYINGSLDASHTGSGAYTGSGSNTRIAGPVLGFGYYLDGNISSVMAYSRVITSTEVTQNYDAFKSRFGY